MADIFRTALETPVITLPTDETRLAQLRKKLEEYEERIRTHRLAEAKVLQDMERSMTRPNFLLRIDTLAKRDILVKLFKEGKVAWIDIQEMSKVYVIEGTADNNDIFFTFHEAFDVIQDYCLTGGQNVHGGRLPPGEVGD